MEQIQKYIVSIFAIVGALCAIARIIVALTPTPKDNIILERISVQLRVIAKVFGLNLTQGRNKKP